MALFSTGFAGPGNLVPLAMDKFLPESAGENKARKIPAQSIVIMLGVIISFTVLELAGTYKMPAVYALIPLCVLACIYLGLKVPPVVLLITPGLIIFSLLIYLMYSKPRTNGMKARIPENILS